VESILNANPVTPFYFGRAGQRIYGCYHVPTPEVSLKGGVILCQSIGHEYIHSHRAFFQLANRLATKGFISLRFDYFGTGDSEGDFEDGGIVRWLEDVRMAVDEMQNRFDIKSISLIGFRIGASLALKTALHTSAVKQLVLWEMVTNGVSYLNEIARMQATFGNSLRIKVKKSIVDPSLPNEILGYPLTPLLISELKKLNLTNLDIPPGCKSLAIFNQSDLKSEFDTLSPKPNESELHLVQYIDDHQLWKNQIYKRLIPVNTLDAISTWLERVSS